MRWQERDIKQIIAKRNLFPLKALEKHRTKRNEGEDDVRLEMILKKSEFTVEDKQEMIRHIQNKCRVYFNESFSISQFQLIVSREDMVLLERDFDPFKTSYYLISGKIRIVPKTLPLLTHSDESALDNVIIQEESGIGWVFQVLQHSGADIFVEGIALQIKHSSSGWMKLIEKNCLMTSFERRLAIKKCKLFSSIQNFNKFFLPYFHTRRYSKGQHIYSIGEEAQEFFLIIDGVVGFESSIQTTNNQSNNREDTRAISQLTRKRRQTIMLITETLCKNNYFGEEEVLSHIPRSQNAKCISIDCLLMVIPHDKIEKMLTYPQFRRNLEFSSTLKQDSRKHQISSYLTLDHNRKGEGQEIASSQTQLKTSIFRQLSNGKEDSRLKSKYSRDKKTVIHNHSLNTPQQLHKNVRISDFSMLNVNKKMYEKTLMRFRYNLKELQTDEKKVNIQRGRSLQQVWKTLKLQKSFNPEEQRIVIDDDEGMKYYNTHKRLAKQIRITKCFRPKSLSCSSKLKSQYIEYLQMII